MHVPCLLAGLLVMIGVTLMPHALTGTDGKAHHGLAMLTLWGMSAGLVRGVGYVPTHRLARLMLSQVTCLITLASSTTWKCWRLTNSMPFSV